MQRRGFLASILAAGFAPAVVGSEILMPVRKIILPEHELRGHFGGRGGGKADVMIAAFLAAAGMTAKDIPIVATSIHVDAYNASLAGFPARDYHFEGGVGVHGWHLVEPPTT